jgi:DNA repair protein RadA/Sms
MGKSRTVYRCTECGSATPKWGGRCGVCAAWNSLVEHDEAAEAVVPSGPSSPALPIGAVQHGGARPRPTGIGELDRVLGGGLVPGSVTLLGGEPGIGKSTLVLQLLAGWPERSLYVSAEESAQQVRLRAERLGAVQPDLWLLPDTSLPRILATIEETRPSLLVVDSIQTIGEPSLPSAPGSVVQVRGCAQRQIRRAHV